MTALIRRKATPRGGIKDAAPEVDPHGWVDPPAVQVGDAKAGFTTAQDLADDAT
ncbi:hypothetical protein [Frankia sp. QA3]|uniref:hypothetical protein n=1 Tax=Frankia sp. QA3 TaxID=710111 RepID=UPI0012FBE80F|nr:hypothetical protein [Frankia sp. QA3]